LVIAFVILASAAPSQQAFDKLSETQFEAFKIKYAKKNTNQLMKIQ
jgi:hypothetical protein